MTTIECKSINISNKNHFKSNLKNSFNHTLSSLVFYESVGLHFVSIKYIEALTQAEIESVISFVKTYSNPIDPTVNYKNIFYANINLTENVYSTINIFPYSPDMEFDVANTSSFKLSNQSFTYSLRIWDITNNNIICEASELNNSDITSEISLGTVNNLPTTPAIFEFQGKLNRKNNTGVVVYFLKLIKYK